MSQEKEEQEENELPLPSIKPKEPDFGKEKKVQQELAKLRLDRLKKEWPDLHGWLIELARGTGNATDRFNILFTTHVSASRVEILFYTRDHCYRIVATVGGHKGEKGYLGATVMTRKPRAGEDWERGNDLHDGRRTKETWDKILLDVLRYEMVRVMHHPEA